MACPQGARIYAATSALCSKHEHLNSNKDFSWYRPPLSIGQRFFPASSLGTTSRCGLWTSAIARFGSASSKTVIDAPTLAGICLALGRQPSIFDRNRLALFGYSGHFSHDQICLNLSEPLNHDAELRNYPHTSTIVSVPRTVTLSLMFPSHDILRNTWTETWCFQN
ncbi:Uncharacterized protein HZ326_21674 [Fusarium oxysporum f. sp. albedinis]|nr:Uncharacterized protein HZ326_21674 [Fusarium oxysporum f. sp. albedinis]